MSTSGSRVQLRGPGEQDGEFLMVHRAGPGTPGGRRPSTVQRTQRITENNILHDGALTDPLQRLCPGQVIIRSETSYESLMKNYFDNIIAIVYLKFVWIIILADCRNCLISFFLLCFIFQIHRILLQNLCCRNLLQILLRNLQMEILRIRQS